MTYCTRPTYITNMYVTLRLNQVHNAVAMLQTYNRNRPWANPRPPSPTLGDFMGPVFSQTYDPNLSNL